MRKLAVVLLIVILMSMLVGCGEEEPTQEPAPVEVPTEAPAEAPTDVPAEAPTAAAPAEEVTATPAEAAQPAAPVEGQYTVDTGFRPQKDGFSFPNYGGDVQATNLTPAEVLRMFGEGVCSGPVQNGVCDLSPVAMQWMEQTNGAMAGGHCEGFAAMSQLTYWGKIAPADFGAGQTSELKLDGNEALQRELAYWWSTQGPIWTRQLTGGAADVIKILSDAYTADPKNLFRIGITKEDGTGGHAITAYAVQDKGNGIYWIMVYDNNYPGQERYIEVDVNADTWQYEASINPSVQPDLYKGSANNRMILAPNDLRIGTQPCDFCTSTGMASKGAGLAAEEPRYNELWMEGGPYLLLVDGDGKKFGYEKGQLIKEIDDIRLQPVLAGDKADEYVPPVFEVPVGKDFGAVLDGSVFERDEPADVIMIGPGYYLGVEGIMMDPDQVDTIYFDGAGDFITYTTDSAEAPLITVGVEREGADYAMDVQAVKVEPGTDIHVEFNGKEGYIALSTTSKGDGQFVVSMTRYEGDKDESFGSDPEQPITMGSGDILYFYFAKWQGEGSNLEIGYDQGGDGTVDEVVNTADIK